MKKPKGVSLEESLSVRVAAAALAKRESASKWIADAIYERFEREEARVKESPNMTAWITSNQAIPKTVRYSKRRKKKRKK